MPVSASSHCPVCGFQGLGEPPYDAHGSASFDICPCCGIEFGYDDATESHQQLRAGWIERGMPWWSQSQPPPVGWDPAAQLSGLQTPPASRAER